MLYRIHFRDGGVSKTGLTPTWLSLLTAVESGTDKSGSAPAIAEIGGGFYTFNIDYGVAPWDDKTKDLVGEIDGGSSLIIPKDRYKLIVITLGGLSLARLADKRDWNKANSTERVYGVDGSSVVLELTRGENDTHKIMTPGEAT